MICRFQEVPRDPSKNFVKRNGIIGNFILDRFEIVIDYPESRFFLKPTRKWKRKFSYDKSGIQFISVGLHDRTYYVNSILEGSPADLAGIQVGDVIKKINRLPSGLLNYNGINRIFQSKAGKKIKMKIKRENQIIKAEFRLKDLI